MRIDVFLKRAIDPSSGISILAPVDAGSGAKTCCSNPSQTLLSQAVEDEKYILLDTLAGLAFQIVLQPLQSLTHPFFQNALLTIGHV